MKAKENGELKIEKGVPMPHRNVRGYGIAALLRQMKVGDSVFFPKGKRTTVSSQASHIFGPGGSTTAEENGGVRLWRRK